MYLGVPDSAILPDGWYREASFSFTMVNQNNWSQSTKKGIFLVQFLFSCICCCLFCVLMLVARLFGLFLSEFVMEGVDGYWCMLS